MTVIQAELMEITIGETTKQLDVSGTWDMLRELYQSAMEKTGNEITADTESKYYWPSVISYLEETFETKGLTKSLAKNFEEHVREQSELFEKKLEKKRTSASNTESPQVNSPNMTSRSSEPTESDIEQKMSSGNEELVPG